MVVKQYKPESLVFVLQHTHAYGVPSKLSFTFSRLCEIIEVSGPILTLRELNTDKILTASHDAVRDSTLPQPEVQPQPKPPHDLPNTQNAESIAEDL